MLQPVEQKPSPTNGEHRISGEFPARRHTFELPVDLPQDKVRQSVRAEVEASLRDVCGNWPTGEFDRIVADVTSTAMKYHGRERRRIDQETGEHKVTSVNAVVTLATTAVQSVQKFFQLETPPLK